MIWNPDCEGPCDCPGIEVGEPDTSSVDETGITVYRDDEPIIRLGSSHPPLPPGRTR